MSAPPDKHTDSWRTGDTPATYQLRRSPRARRVRVSVERDGTVVVTTPARLQATSAQAAAARAVRELAPWINRRLDELQRQQAAVRARGDTLPYLGEHLTVIEQAGRTRVHRRGETLLAPAGADRQPALERWYRRMAQAEFTTRAEHACARAGVHYARLTVRDQRTRWGSCSRAGTLSFNWRLLLAPPPVLDYVVWHEVCHLVVMDHSPRFWALVGQHCPEHRRHVAWLRVNAATLVL